MPDDPPRRWAAEDQTAARLVKETGITRKQAEELIQLLGIQHWSSLLREAKILAKEKGCS